MLSRSCSSLHTAALYIEHWADAELGTGLCKCLTQVLKAAQGSGGNACAWDPTLPSLCAESQQGLQQQLPPQERGSNKSLQQLSGSAGQPAKTLTRAKAAEVEALLRDVWGRVDEPDSLYALAGNGRAGPDEVSMHAPCFACCLKGLHPMRATSMCCCRPPVWLAAQRHANVSSHLQMLQLCEREGDWPSALASYDLLIHSSLSSASGSGCGLMQAQGQVSQPLSQQQLGLHRGLAYSLSRLGCGHAAQGYLQGVTASSPGGPVTAAVTDPQAQELQWELAWRLGQWGDDLSQGLPFVAASTSQAVHVPQYGSEAVGFHPVGSRGPSPGPAGAAPGRGYGSFPGAPATGNSPPTFPIAPVSYQGQGLRSAIPAVTAVGPRQYGAPGVYCFNQALLYCLRSLASGDQQQFEQLLQGATAGGVVAPWVCVFFSNPPYAHAKLPACWVPGHALNSAPLQLESTSPHACRLCAPAVHGIPREFSSHAAALSQAAHGEALGRGLGAPVGQSCSCRCGRAWQCCGRRSACHPWSRQGCAGRW